MATAINAPCDDGVIAAGAADGRCAPRAGPWVLAATILGSSMAFIDGTVVNVALPALQAQLQATSAQVQWVVQAYALLLAALILVGGSLGDRFGRRRVYALGVILFAAASVGCGLAQSISQLIAARAVQGVGGALLVPGSLAIISAAFDEARRGQAIGTWSGFTGITSAVGPVLGGWLVEHGSWRWVFFINVPLALAVLGLVALHVPESRDETAAGPLDWPGALLAALGLGSTVYGLTVAADGGLAQPAALGWLAAGLLALGLFLLRERRAAAPMMPLSLFRARTFAGANLLTFLLYAALGGAFFFVPFNLIQVQGYGATQAGASLLPMILIMFVLSRWTGGLVAKVGARRPLTIGPAIAACGFALFARPGVGGSYWTTYFPAVVVLGLGMAIAVAPLTTTVMGAVEQRHAGLASGINNAVSRVAGLLSIAVLNLVLATVFAVAYDSHLAPLPLPPLAREALAGERRKLAGAAVPADLPADVQAALRQAIDESYVAGFRVVMLTAAGLAFASALSAWLLIRDQPRTAPPAPQSWGE
jgi:EmrB/QacA subfamily drug resistance transporter